MEKIKLYTGLEGSGKSHQARQAVPKKSITIEGFNLTSAEDRNQIRRIAQGDYGGIIFENIQQQDIPHLVTLAKAVEANGIRNICATYRGTHKHFPLTILAHFEVYVCKYDEGHFSMSVLNMDTVRQLISYHSETTRMTKSAKVIAITAIILAVTAIALKIWLDFFN